MGSAGLAHTAYLPAAQICSVRHYGKAISVEEWERTCDYYAHHTAEPGLAEKWAARRGKAVHEYWTSDFGNKLIRWRERHELGIELTPEVAAGEASWLLAGPQIRSVTSPTNGPWCSRQRPMHNARGDRQDTCDLSSRRIVDGDSSRLRF